LTEQRSNGCPINTAIAIAMARGIVKDTESSLLSENGGHINLTKEWANYLLQRMNYVKKRGCSTAKVLWKISQGSGLSFYLIYSL